MLLIAVRGVNGSIAWRQEMIGAHSWAWVCVRDSFTVVGPQEPQEVEPAVQAILQHSVALVGAVQQLVQVDL
jgi:hypothetical protein